jgi:hypothetical protein
MAISKIRIRAAEQDYEDFLAGKPVDIYDEAENKKFIKAAVDGTLKWTILKADDGGDVLVPLAPEDPEYNSKGAFNTPQEAEHFTPGFGREPGRTWYGKTAGAAFAPVTQHNLTDPVRAEQRDVGADITQDVIGDTRYLLPMLGGYLPTPAKAALAAGSMALGLGTIPAAMSTGRGEPWYAESPSNVALTAAAAAAGAAGNKYFTEENVRDRQLKKHVANQLALSPNELESGLLPDIKEKLQTTPYTFEDWRNRAFKEFDTKNPNAEVKFKKVPYPHKPSPQKDKVQAGIMPKGVEQHLTNNQWDAVAFKFKTDMGMPEADINDVKKFIQNAYGRNLTTEGQAFYNNKGMSKKKWTEVRATEENPLTRELYKSQAYFEDPVMDQAYRAAYADYKDRWRRMKNKKGAAIITPQQYEKMGKIKGPILGKDIRKPLRLGTTMLLPIATELLCKYALPKIFGGSDE